MDFKTLAIAVAVGVACLFGGMQFSSHESAPSAANYSCNGGTVSVPAGVSSVVPQSSEFPLKFGSGTESASFAGNVNSLYQTQSSVTTTIANANANIALFSNIGTVTSTFMSATGTCFSVVSPTGTRIYLTWNGGASGAWTGSTTNCQ